MKRPSPADSFFRRKEAVRDGILRIAAAIVGEATYCLSRPVAAHGRPIHEVRLCLKRARAIFRLLRPTLGDDFCTSRNARLRTAAQRLSAARQSNVGVRILKTVGRQFPKEDLDTLSRLRDEFGKSAAAETAQVQRLDEHLRAAASVLRSAFASLEQTPWKLRGWRCLEAGLRKSYRRARRRYKAAARSPGVASFHDWRTATKSLMYQLLFLQKMGGSSFERLLKELDLTQDALGHANDFADIDAWIAKASVSKKDKSGIARISARLATRSRSLQKKALKHGRRAFGASPAQFIDRVAADWKAWRKS